MHEMWDNTGFMKYGSKELPGVWDGERNRRR